MSLLPSGSTPLVLADARRLERTFAVTRYVNAQGGLAGQTVLLRVPLR